MKIAFVAALEREVKPLVRNWPVAVREYNGRQYKFFENEGAVLVCAGIGPEAARRAAAAIIDLYSPHTVWSIGFAGALDSELKVGASFQPQRVVDTGDSSSTAISGGRGTLVSSGSIADPQQKNKLSRAYGAQAVDMEAAAVARAALAKDVHFAAYKVISDEYDFEFPAMDRFIRNGQFRQASFLAYVAVRPWLWPKVLRLAGNSSRASAALCRWLVEYIAAPETLENKRVELHPMK